MKRKGRPRAPFLFPTTPCRVGSDQGSVFSAAFVGFEKL
jgi:hypothetical protein